MPFLFEDLCLQVNLSFDDDEENVGILMGLKRMVQDRPDISIHVR